MKAGHDGSHNASLAESSYLYIYWQPSVEFVAMKMKSQNVPLVDSKFFVSSCVFGNVAEVSVTCTGNYVITWC